MSYEGKAAIVTGAGNGLGRHYALDLAKRGASVVVNDLSSDNVNAVVKEIVDAGGKAVACAANVTNGKVIVDKAIQSFGQCDVLINNAGILRDRSFHKMSKEEWQSVIDVHLQGTFELCHAVWPLMRERGYGRIVNVTSGAGLFGNFGQGNYAAAKMGIVGLTSSLAHEGAKVGITANCIAPIAASQMTSSLLPKEYLELLDPAHVTAMVSYLAHESAADVNGQIFEVGGGWYARIRWERSVGRCVG
jgi:NAD(P)-dependent dehydrogenase (short-subunit alcohol dehydrogenase family)